MKRLLISTLLGVLSLGAIAQTAPESEVRIHGRQIELPAQPYHMFLGDFDVYKGGYELSNGETMELFSRGTHMFAVIGERPRTEMVAASPNEFVAVDKQFKMTLARQSGEVTGEVLLRAPSNVMAKIQEGDVASLLARR
ncbi:MAG TPA: hypothetical protein VFS02_17210 [Telluria sp.]|nr:hypothetical protein [Telluria sp.]